MKHNYFSGLQETSTANTNPIQNQIVTPQIVDADDISEVSKPTTTKSNISKVNLKSAKNNKPQIPQPQFNRKTAKFKDSIDDFDDLLTDFEKKYSSTNNNNNSNINQGGIPKPIPKNDKMVTQQNSTSPVRSNLKSPQHNSNSIFKDSLFAQFKDDPIFGELMQTTVTTNPTVPKNQPKTDIPLNNNISNNISKRQPTLYGNMNSDNIQRNNTFYEASQMKIDSTIQKKKFDDLFNSITNPDATKQVNNSVPNNKNAYFFNDDLFKNTNNNTNKNNSNNKLFDDILFEDENKKPSAKKPQIQFQKPNNQGMNNNLFSDTNLNNSNKKRGLNPVKSGRNDILEEIFGEDLFASMSNRSHTPAMSKNKPQLSKKVINNSNSNNKYDDLFKNPNNNNNATATNNKDIFDFDFDSELAFMKEESNNKANEFNTRRSRYLPSGKRDSIFAIPSANKINSAKGWNQPQIKIGGPGIGINVGGGGGGAPVNNMGSGNQGNGGAYVPSFMDNPKVDKKSNEKNKCHN